MQCKLNHIECLNCEKLKPAAGLLDSSCSAVLGLLCHIFTLPSSCFQAFPEKDIIWMGAYIALKSVYTFQLLDVTSPDVHCCTPIPLERDAGADNKLNSRSPL